MRESPGFITTRVNASIGNEAFYMLMEGVASARDIDKALKLGLNHPMGPFELVDLVGLDTRLSILEYLHRSMGEKYRPCPLLAQYVEGRPARAGRSAGGVLRCLDTTPSASRVSISSILYQLINVRPHAGRGRSHPPVRESRLNAAQRQN